MKTVEFHQSQVLLRNMSRKYPVITHGKGIFLFDRSGKKYIDAVSGAFVASVGHGNAKVAKAVSDQLRKVGYVNGTQFTTDTTEKLAAELARCAKPLGLNRSFFLSSGSEAVEAAIKFARQLCVARNEGHRTKLIARVPSYHGNTLYALSASGRPHYKQHFAPLMHDVLTISTPSRWKSPVQDYDNNGADYYARELENLLEREGKSVFALIVEPISGSSLGASLPPNGYFEKVSTLCKKFGVPIIADEVLTGVGRTGKMFACEHFDFQPDILTLGKGLNGGYAPLSAVLVQESAVQEIKKAMGGFSHFQTYMQAPCMTSAGLAVLSEIKQRKLVKNAAVVGRELQKLVNSEIAPLPQVGFTSGIGLMCGIEFVDANGEPYSRDKKIAERLVEHALLNGMTLWGNVGHHDGHRGDLVMVGPPLTVTKPEIQKLVQLLQNVIESFFAAHK